MQSNVREEISGDIYENLNEVGGVQKCVVLSAHVFV